MKLSIGAFTLSMLLGASAHMDDIRAKRRLTKSFMEAMKEPTIAAARKKGQAQKLRKLHENLAKASRDLSSYSSYYQNGNANANQNANQNANNGNNYYAQYGQENGVYTGYYQNGVYYPWEEAPFDMTSRAFKYSGCAAIKTYDSDRGYSNGNPMVMDTYAVFRLCPADKCNDYSMTGCSKNYGEYAVEMKTYLAYILDYYDDRFEEYCDYCEPCDWEYQATVKTDLSTCYSNQAKYAYQYSIDSGNTAQYSQNQQQQQNSNGWSWSWGGNKNNNANSASSSSSSGNVASSSSGYNYQQYYSKNNGNRELENNNQYDNQAQGTYGYYDPNTGEWVETEDAETAEYGEGYANYKPGQTETCADGSTCDVCSYKMEQMYSYCDSYTCGDYYTFCSDLYGEQDDDFDPMDYLECQGYVNEMGQQYYIGPHCGSDHYTISLGVFSDENCLKYMGDDISLASVLGYTYSDQDIFKLPKQCISCDGSVTSDGELQYEEYNQNQQGVYGDYVSSPESTQDGVVAMCLALYSGSAQCNMNMNNFEQISRYMSQYELDQESRYCAFIENIIFGAYDESGEILLRPEQFNFNDWKNPHQYKKLKMPVSQAVGLAFSIVLCVALLAVAAVTNRSLTRDSTPWKPSRADMALARQNSGILMGRSRSGPGAAPLI